MSNSHYLQYVKRYLVLTIGLFIMAFGVALSTKVNLGTSPISCVPFVLSMVYPWTIGEITIAMNFLFIIFQIILLRRKFPPVQFLQVAVSFMFGYFTDLSMAMVAPLQVTAYPLQWLVCLLSFVFLAAGVFCEAKADVVMMSGEGVVSALSQTFHGDFARMKIFFDSFLVTIGICLSLWYFRDLVGVREGTVAAALLVGSLVRFYSQKIHFLDKF